MNTPKQINDGGPAFPCEEQIRCSGEVIDTRKFTGMTLRDYFAGQALENEYTDDTIPSADVARWAYKVADAMIKAREAKP